MDGATTVGVIGPADGQRVINPIGGAMMVKVRDDATHGNYSIHDNILPANSPGPRVHRHLRHDELFYVIAGTLAVWIDGTSWIAPAGSFVVIPHGAAHRPSNPAPEPVHVLVLFSPEGMDTFFTDAAEYRIPLGGGPVDPAVADATEAFCARYDFEFADLPATDPA